MNINLRVVAFGIFSGLLWSLIAFHPKALLGSGETPALVFLAVGIATGITVSFVLRIPLAKYGLWCSLVLGFLALPLGAFIFGFLFGLVSIIGGSFTDAGGGFRPAMPFAFGFYGAMISVVSLYYLFPVAIFTTFLLRAIIRRGGRPTQSNMRLDG